LKKPYIIFTIILISAVLSGNFAFGDNLNYPSRRSDKTAHTALVEAKLSPVMENLLTTPPQLVVERNSVDYGEILEKLAFCESRGNENAINPDDNGSPSYGKYQYKKETWISFLRRYDFFPEAEDEELMNFIFDGNIQDELTRTILMLENKGWKHWYNCSVKTGIDKEL
jgi:hypothetical protein